MPEQRQDTRNPGRSRLGSRTPPPRAQQVVFHEGMDRDHGGAYDPQAQRTSSTTNSRRRSNRPRTKQAQIPTILTPVEWERQAALHAGPRRAADGASSSSAASLPGSAADPLPGGPHATDMRPREPAADPRPAQGVGGQPPPSPPPPPPERGAVTPVPDSGTDHPTERTRAPRRSPPILPHSQTARARRAHRNNGNTTRAAQGRTRK